MIRIMLAALSGSAGASPSPFRVLAVVVCVFVSSAAGAAETSYEITPDVVYGHKSGMALTFDVIRPRDPAKRNGAGVLFMVSGAWVSGWHPPAELMASDTGWGKYFLKIVDAGYTLFVVRHSSAPIFKVPDAVADVRRAVRFIHQNAATWDVDPDRLGVCGSSAGGHLSLMLGTTGDDGNAKAADPVDRSESHVAAVVAYFPPVDLRQWVGDKRFEGLHFDPKLAESVSPLLHVTPDDAPTLLIHGTEDGLVRLDNSERIAKAFEEKKVPHELLIIDGAGHAFLGEDGERASTALVEWFDEYIGEEK